jgi:hypothetical protein
MEYVSIDIECGCPLLSLIEAHVKFKSLRTLVNIHLFEMHALLAQKVPGCARVFAVQPGVHSDMFWFKDPPRSALGAVQQVFLAPTNIIFSVGVRGGVTSECPLSVSHSETENSTETGEMPITVVRCPSSRKR